MLYVFLCIEYSKYSINLNLPVTSGRNTNKTYIHVYIHISLCVLCLCVFVFQFNFYVEREAFQMGKHPLVASPQSIFTSRVLRTCYMLHPKYSFLSLAKKFWAVQIMDHLIVQTPPVFHYLVPLTAINKNIFWNYFAFFCIFNLFQNFSE